jgi:cell division protein FtsL
VAVVEVMDLQLHKVIQADLVVAQQFGLLLALLALLAKAMTVAAIH